MLSAPAVPVQQGQYANNGQQNVQNADDTELITQPGEVPPPPPPPGQAAKAPTHLNELGQNNVTPNTQKNVSIDQMGGQQLPGLAELKALFKKKNIGQSTPNFNESEQNANGPAVPPKSSSTSNFYQPNSPLHQAANIDLPYTIPGYLNSYRKSGGDMPLVLKYNDKKVEANFTNFHLNPELFIELSIRKDLLCSDSVNQNRLMAFLTGGQALTVDQQKLVTFLNNCDIHSLDENAETAVDDVNATLNNDFINYALSLYNDMSGINLFKNLSKEGQAALLPTFHKYIGEHFLGDGIYRYNILTRCYAPWLTLNKVVKCDNDTNHTDIRSIANGIYGRTNEKELRSSYVNLAKSTLTNVYIQHSGVDLSEEDKSAIKKYYSNAKI